VFTIILALIFSTDFADYTDYNECEVEIVKSAGFNSLQLAALGLNLTFIDTPWFAAGKFILFG
jgi:hypothetical protein